VIRSAIDRGVNLFDHRGGFGPYVNEELVGEALEPVRDQVPVRTSCLPICAKKTRIWPRKF
jgi:aryl-alcohol dehydrogenase-like predicted oxidoreductase